MFSHFSPLFTLPLLACAVALSACQTDGPSAQATPQEAKPPTRQEAALHCWMTVEKAHPNMSLDQRADIVTKCIDDWMNGKQPAAAASVKPSKPKT